IAIRITGIRPGEKLYEELAKDDEQTRPTSHPKIRVWRLAPATRGEVERMLKLLGSVVDGTRDEVIGALRQVVAEYGPGPAQPTGLRLVNDADREAVIAA
ncbi:MAG: polysaccharide biosynthesis protein, partial [Bacillota bacterium]